MILLVQVPSVLNLGVCFDECLTMETPINIPRSCTVVENSTSELAPALNRKYPFTGNGSDMWNVDGSWCIPDNQWSQECHTFIFNISPVDRSDGIPVYEFRQVHASGSCWSIEFADGTASWLQSLCPVSQFVIVKTTDNWNWSCCFHLAISILYHLIKVILYMYTIVIYFFWVS